MEELQIFYGVKYYILYDKYINIIYNKTSLVHI